jgi:Mlc titration factor MtfA (ptsG expression regulator)
LIALQTTNELRDALDAAFPGVWRDILVRRAPFYRALDDDEQERFEDKLQHFVLTKRFSGRKLAITDEMKVVVAAAACRLTIGLPWEDYRYLSDVTLRAEEAWDYGRGRVIGHAGQRKVTMSWPALVREMADPDDGYNVGFHEFAHALDGADGETDGGPEGPPRAIGGTWMAVLARARTDLLYALKWGEPVALDRYAAKNDTEMFAVATESFFERPVLLRKRMTALYELLRAYYRQDPAARG